MLTPRMVYAEVDMTIHPEVEGVTIDNLQQAQENMTNIAGNASLVTDKAWTDQRADNIKDITDYMPGVIDQPRDGAESNRLSIRGSGLANIFQGRGLLVLQDGIPINMADGEFEFPAIDPWLIRYAEVFPGANALEYGGSTLGGAINFITPTGATEPGYGVRFEGGSFDTLHGQLAYGQHGEATDIYATASGFLQDGYRQQNEQQTGRLNANWGWQPNSHFINRVYLNHTLSDAEIPGAISLTALHSDPQQANAANDSNNYQRNLNITRIADKSAWADGANRVDTTIFYTYRTLDNPVTTYEFQHNNDTGLRVKYTHQDNDNRKWLIGFNTYYGHADESRYVNLDGYPGNAILDRNLYASTNELYGQVEQRLIGQLSGIVGVQGAYDMRNIDQSFPMIAVQDKYYAGLSPKIGLRYNVDDITQIYGNVSRSFEPPTWSELSGGNNPGFHSLNAQTATTFEIGSRGQWNTINWQAAYYHSWLHDEFVNYQFSNGSTNTINAARSMHDGIELGMGGDIQQNIWLERDALVARAAYTFSHFNLDHDPLYGNNTLPGVPEHYLRAELLYRHPSHLSFGPNVEVSPQPSPVDLTNTLYAPAYALLGARAFWESDDQKFGFYVEGRNLLDSHYVATYNVVPNASGVDGNYFYPGEGRALYVGFHYRY